jgi:hypothetical protein
MHPKQTDPLGEVLDIVCVSGFVVCQWGGAGTFENIWQKGLVAEPDFVLKACLPLCFSKLFCSYMETIIVKISTTIRQHIPKRCSKSTIVCSFSAGVDVRHLLSLCRLGDAYLHMAKIHCLFPHAQLRKRKDVRTYSFATSTVSTLRCTVCAYLHFTTSTVSTIRRTMWYDVHCVCV